jgi:2-dehydro-3-deoxy-D-arabinonate dehydratase
MTSRLCRFQAPDGDVHIGLVSGDGLWVRDLSEAGVERMETLLEADAPAAELERLAVDRLAPAPLSVTQLCAPLERQEVWAAGVTYLRSKVARMEESDFSATAYDRVYDAPRPEIFFKSLADKVVAPGQAVGIRQDAIWSVPEPELALVLNSRGHLAGCTIGNDMSSRDIEGENLLYLPQAKVYDRSCAVGPWIVLGAEETDARNWAIQISVRRKDAEVFAGETSPSQLKRTFEELIECLFRSQRFPHGVLLLTGTGIVPPDSFTLQGGDIVDIGISGIGRLTNPVVVV